MPLTPIEGQPGLFRDSDTGQIVNIRDFRESAKYDTILIPATEIPPPPAVPTGITPGTQFIFFQDIQGKRETDTNIKTPRKLSAGESMVLDRIGLYFRLATGDVVTVPRDIKKVVDNAFYKLKINDILQDEGPAIRFPSGLGLYGNTTETDAGIVSLGVPATASAARLVKKQLINQNHELDGVLEFTARTWLAALGLTYENPIIEQPLLVTNYLHGLIRAAVTK
jgi:hypothetical protein